MWREALLLLRITEANSVADICMLCSVSLTNTVQVVGNKSCLFFLEICLKSMHVCIALG